MHRITLLTTAVTHQLYRAALTATGRLGVDTTDDAGARDRRVARAGFVVRRRGRERRRDRRRPVVPDQGQGRRPDHPAGRPLNIVAACFTP
jgi:hypothetical protein